MVTMNIDIRNDATGIEVRTDASASDGNGKKLNVAYTLHQTNRWPSDVVWRTTHSPVVALRWAKAVAEGKDETSSEYASFAVSTVL